MSPTVSSPNHRLTLSLQIEGMHCASCVGRVQRALSEVEGVKQVSVNLATDRADVETDQVVDHSSLINAIESAGFKVAEQTTELLVSGMTCASCVGRVERALKAVPGVSEVSINLA